MIEVVETGIYFKDLMGKITINLEPGPDSYRFRMCCQGQVGYSQPLPI